MRVSIPAVKRQSGVTLIELMIVIGIIGVLVSIGYPSYTSYVRVAKRAEAHTAVMNAAAELEKLYGRQGSFKGAVFGDPEDASEFRIGPSQSKNSDGLPGDYSMTVTVPENGARYDITATATGRQLADKQCRKLFYSVETDKTSTDDAGQASSDCW